MICRYGSSAALQHPQPAKTHTTSHAEHTEMSIGSCLLPSCPWRRYQRRARASSSPIRPVDGSYTRFGVELFVNPSQENDANELGSFYLFTACSSQLHVHVPQPDGIGAREFATGFGRELFDQPRFGKRRRLEILFSGLQRVLLRQGGVFNFFFFSFFAFFDFLLGPVLHVLLLVSFPLPRFPFFAGLSYDFKFGLCVMPSKREGIFSRLVAC